MQPNTATAQAPAPITCARCHTALSRAQDQVVTPGGILCRPCSNNLRSDLERAAQEQSQDINYPMALLGALLGGSAGVLAWWGITVWTNTAFGVVAILIGIAVGKGVTLLAGNKRSRSLQALSVTVAGGAFFYATYLVNRTFVQQALAKEGKEIILTLLPNPSMFLHVITLNFDMLDTVFLAIVLWEAWKIPAPAKLR